MVPLSFPVLLRRPDRDRRQQQHRRRHGEDRKEQQERLAGDAPGEPGPGERRCSRG